jgi:hypothetical protein
LTVKLQFYIFWLYDLLYEMKEQNRMEQSALAGVEWSDVRE